MHTIYITLYEKNLICRCKDISICTDENIKNMIKTLEKYS